MDVWCQHRQIWLDLRQFVTYVTITFQSRCFLGITALKQILRQAQEVLPGLKKCHIEPESWEVRAQDRASWRNLVKRGVSNHERDFIAQAVEKRKTRKERQENLPTLLVSLSFPPLQPQLPYSDCRCQSYAHTLVQPVPGGMF